MGESRNEQALRALTGRVIDGRYLLERVVGSGGFAVVFRASHLRFQRPVAIKMLGIGSGATRDERRNIVASFLAEGKLLFELGGLHPSIVRVFETGTVECADGTTPYLAMEWLDGLPLDREIERRREHRARTLDEVMALLDEAVRGLSAAHRKRIAHRDIKPANIFLSVKDERVSAKLLDFGVAKAFGESVTQADAYDDTGCARSSFTPAYAAPEQWLRRLGATGPWTDVHALALVLTELLCGRRAFDGNGAELMAQCLDVIRPTPRALGVEVSDEVERVFAQALALKPRERFADADEFWSALRRASSAGGVALRAAPAPQPLASRPNDARAPRRIEPTRVRRGTRRLVRAASAILLVTLLVGGHRLSRQRTASEQVPLPVTTVMASTATAERVPLQVAPLREWSPSRAERGPEAASACNTSSRPAPAAKRRPLAPLSSAESPRAEPPAPSASSYSADSDMAYPQARSMSGDLLHDEELKRRH
jgi:serine/threonine protein kinase